MQGSRFESMRILNKRKATAKPFSTKEVRRRIHNYDSFVTLRIPTKNSTTTRTLRHFTTYEIMQILLYLFGGSSPGTAYSSTTPI